MRDHFVDREKGSRRSLHWFVVVEDVEIDILLFTIYIDRCIKGISPADRTLTAAARNLPDEWKNRADTFSTGTNLDKRQSPVLNIKRTVPQGVKS